MVNISRIYLSGPTGIRQFYWVELADDKSLYIGTSNVSRFGYGFGGEAMSSPSMLPIVPESDGRALSKKEIENKTSFHGSGVVNLITESSGRRDRLVIAPLRDGLEALPLSAVLPMMPTCYPVTKKTVKPTDMCLPEFIQEGLPIGVLFYVCSNMAFEPAPIAAVKQRLSLVQERSCMIGDFVLRAIVYSDPLNLRSWPQEEIHVVAHPAAPGGEPNWPFFG
ncbi:hypothetical protein [Undibacterium sp.]|uniref:hypothetical protein n=1 Tax=Undibacterium sp. TaxID=1914977 RepID=UPI0025DABF31|nr:hypothetical protein [Undibacterium sp.]